MVFFLDGKQPLHHFFIAFAVYREKISSFEPFDVIAHPIMPGGKYFQGSSANKYFDRIGMSSPHSTDSMFVFSLARRGVHVNDQGLDPHLSQGHGGGNADGAGTNYYYIFVQVYLSPSRITLQA